MKFMESLKNYYHFLVKASPIAKAVHCGNLSLDDWNQNYAKKYYKLGTKLGLLVVTALFILTVVALV